MKMNKKLIWTLVWWGLLMSSMWSVFAYSIWSPIQYVKQLYVTPAWNSNPSAATIKLDGANGNISSKSLSVAWNYRKWTTNPKAILEVWKRKSSWVYGDDNSNNNHIVINWAYTYYNGNVSQSTYPVLDVNSERNEWPKSILSVWYGWNITDMFTKISAWSRHPTSGKYDTANYIAIWENWNTYTPWNILINWNVWIWTTDPQAKLDVQWNIRMNWQLVATQAYAKKISTIALNSAKTYIVKHNGLRHVSTCSPANIGKTNSWGQVCTMILVTNQKNCVAAKKDGVFFHRGNRITNVNICKDWALRWQNYNASVYGYIRQTYKTVGYKQLYVFK